MTGGNGSITFRKHLLADLQFVTTLSLCIPDNCQKGVACCIHALQDYILPAEYVSIMRDYMLDKCPVSTYKDIAQVIQEDLGKSPEELFASIEEVPIASASLAQVILLVNFFVLYHQSHIIRGPSMITRLLFWFLTVNA